jgi:hypothetical protein
MHPLVQLLVRPVVVPADDVRDPEVDVVDDRGEVVRRCPVLTDQRDPIEALRETSSGLAVPLETLARLLRLAP